MTRVEKCLKVVGLGCVVAAVGCALVLMLGIERLRPLGEFIRRADDVTPERVIRLRLVCAFFAVIWGVIGILLLKKPSAAAQAIREFRSELVTQVSSGIRGVPAVVWWLVAAGAGLRLAFLNVPMAYDESYSFVNFASQPVHLAIGEYNSTNNHLLNTLGMHVCYQIFGQRDWALRLPVLCFGIALLPAVWFWGRARGGDRVAVIALALCAIAPALVSYSVNARGYLYVTTCAVVLDLALLRISCQHPHQRLNWFAAWLAVVIGCCAMPLMIYSLVGICGWYVCGPLNTVRERFRTIALLASASIPAVVLFYTPAFIFRGLLFLRDPIVQSVPLSEAAAQLGSVCADAFRWWSAGPIPWWIWALVVIAGGVRWAMSGRSAWALAFPFVAALLLTIAQSVTPPPRIFLYLTPWVTLIAAGVIGLPYKQHAMGTVVALSAVALSIIGGAHLLTRPVLFEASERINYVSVPDAMTRLAAEIRDSDHSKQRLIAPLPCDLPSIYSMRQRGFEIPVNGEPTPDETVWLIARRDEQPAEVLASSLVALEDRIEMFAPWERVDEWSELTLYRSHLLEKSREDQP